MLLLTDIVAALRTDLADPLRGLFEDAVAQRAVQRALVTLNSDLGAAHALVDTGGGALAIEPEPSAGAYEMLLLLGKAHLASVLKVTHAEDFRFSSGDKSADLTQVYRNWSDYEEGLRAEYKTLLQRLRPELAGDVLSLGHSALVFEIGSDTESDRL